MARNSRRPIDQSACAADSDTVLIDGTVGNDDDNPVNGATVCVHLIDR